MDTKLFVFTIVLNVCLSAFVSAAPPSVCEFRLDSEKRQIVLTLKDKSIGTSGTVVFPEKSWNLKGDLFRYDFRSSQKKIAILSPDGKRAAKDMLNHIDDKTDEELLIMDLRDQTVKETGLSKNYIHYYYRFQWISNSKVMVDMGPIFQQMVVSDVDTGKIFSKKNVYMPIWDRAGENYVEAWQNSECLGYIDEIIKTRQKMTMFVRYNGYWVYPEPIQAPVEDKEFADINQWLTDHSDEPFYYHQASSLNPAKPETSPSILLGKGQKTSYLFMWPCFIADTQWAAFVETELDVSNPEAPAIEQTRLVLLDASAVKENPPNAQNIHIKKKTIPNLCKPENSEHWLDYYQNTMMLWNDDQHHVEIWKNNRTFKKRGIPTPKQPRQKVGHIPIDPKTLEIGEPVYELTGDKFPWAQWVVMQ